MKKILIFILLFIPLFLHAKDNPSYAVSKIDASVLLTESSVIRNHKTTIHLQENNAILREKKVVTLLSDDEFDHYNYMVASYDSSERINEFEVTIYDKFGNEIKQYKQKDVEDISTSGGGHLTDNRLKYVEISEYNYPFTVEFIYEKKVKDTYLLLPRWELSENPDSYTEKSSLTIHKPASIDYTLDYRLHGRELDTDQVSSEKIEFVAINVESFGSENFGPKRYNQKPHIILSPHFFEIEGYKGSFENWSSLGDFYHQINEDRYELDEEFVQPLEEMISTSDSVEEKAKKIYQYMQSRTRYVSVQLGIGGWQSFPAEYVEKNSYGDCKALTTYTKSLLGHFDIESYPVLINAGDDNNDMSYDLNNTAYSGFNHVILAIPQEKDTLWMECTSQTNPFNYLGSFTMDRKGLIVKPNGESQLVSTQSSNPTEDIYKDSYTVDLNENGSAIITVDIEAKGIPAEYLNGANNHLSDKELKERLADILDIPNSILIDYELKSLDGEMGVELTAKFETKNIANKTGSRIFLNPLQFLTKRPTPNHIDDRKHPIILPFSYSSYTEVSFNLPEGYSIENAEDDPIKMTEEFGTFEAEFSMEAEKIDVSSVYKQKSGIYSPQSAKDLNDFCEGINEVKDRMIVLKKN